MVSLARASLIYEWRRYLPAVLAVAFSGLLLLIQLALLLGLFGTVSTYVDQSDADLWVGYPDAKSVDLGRDISELNEVLVRMHPEVIDVEHFIMTGGDWRGPSGEAVAAFATGIDTRPGAMGLSRIVTPEQRALLDEPNAIIVDEVEADKLGIEVGSVGEINRRRVRVVALIRGLRAVAGVNIITSLPSARTLEGAAPSRPSQTDGERPSDKPVVAAETLDATYYLVRLRDPTRAETVAQQLTPPEGARRPYSVWVSQEFSTRSQLYWLLESGSGAGFAFSSLLGLFVGIVITSQTLMAAIVGAIREYATLQALGVSIASLRAVVLEQAWWVGLLGLLTTGLISVGVSLTADHARVLMLFPLWSIVVTAILNMIIALGSGLFAMRALRRAEPASLLR